VTASCIALWRLTHFIPMPGVSPLLLQQLLEAAPGQQGIFVGSPVYSVSIGHMGLNPWFNAVIVLLLLGFVSPRLHFRIRANPSTWLRGTSLILASGQAYGLSILLQSTNPPAIGDMTWFGRVVVMSSLVGATMLLVFLGEVVDEHGFGFGRMPFLFFSITIAGDLLPRLAGSVGGPIELNPGYLLAVGLVVLAAVGVTGLTVAGLLAHRTVGQGKQPRSVPLIVSGILIPPIVAASVVFLPIVLANFMLSGPAGSDARAVGVFVRAYWQPYGSSVAGNAAYLAVSALMIIASGMFVVALRYASSTRVQRVAIRLSVAGGFLLATLIVGVPELLYLLTGVAGYPHRLGMTDIVLYVGIGWPALVLVAMWRAGVKRPRAPVQSAI
jgi:preprotein translocase subunit SecY